MAITTLVKIGSTVLPQVRKFTVGRNKLWADAGRNMKGEIKATFIGIFIKLEIEFAPLSQSQMSQLIGLLDDSYFTVKWWDEETDALKSGTFYAGDYNYAVLKKVDGLYDGFKVSLIATKKLS